MIQDTKARILDRLELGLRTDVKLLNKVERELSILLKSALEFGQHQDLGEAWQARWQTQWDSVDGILCRSRMLRMAMEDSLKSSGSERFVNAHQAWENLQSEDYKLLEALSATRTHATGLPPGVLRDWNELASQIESHLETLRGCGQALRVKLELSKQHSSEESERLIDRILVKLPDRSLAELMDAEEYGREYCRAAATLEHERHKYMGFVDVVKGLLMWVEQPGERASKHLSPQDDARPNPIPADRFHFFSSETSK